MTTDSPDQGQRKAERYRPNAGLAVFSGAGRVLWGTVSARAVHGNGKCRKVGSTKAKTLLKRRFESWKKRPGSGRLHVELLQEMDEWLYYDFPPDLKARLGGPYLGQRQKWFAFRLIGAENDIKLDLHEPEFDAWKWVELADAPHAIIPFKRPVYERVAEAFTQWTQ